MSNQLDLKDEIKAEKKKFKTLNFDQKISYIIDYYWIHILTVIIIAITAFAIYKTYQAKNFDTVLYTVLINNDKSVWDDDTDKYELALSQSFADYIGVDNDKERVIIDNNYIIDLEKDAEMSVYSAESLVALMYGNGLDIHMGNMLSLDYFCEDEYTFFYDLRDIFDEEFLEKHKELIVTHTYKDGTEVPIAFNVTDCKLIQEAGLTVNPVIICVFHNTTRLETAVEYIEFILEEK